MMFMMRIGIAFIYNFIPLSTMQLNFNEMP